ncbi:MAG: homoserine dehydrogenase [Candidatus Margulisiibacteriota bacterium]|nr:MAG: homoserine dehydrogenase [Candidatus Margulisbacteria bacterium GWD2_39_127]OGI05500.1 MAG: homoserine dehydrogenase [Candidatus Margulisbacteria bacterium GWF2_38_17]OGI08302.1 MAG: homoserine dehydrogenase [Candidatus Margulisbacteria bacterium GWE2_39_32]PZM82296.1 MAG: homoserine dehydrogenase [Candidatus Margulisiibacteriota bacterium]HAR62958.1 homoserine dehydrogenase [Candidatus Margulisiibacteriota bacterium]
MKDKINIGILGYGNIGMGAAKILIENKEIITNRTGKQLILKKIADLDIDRKRAYQVDRSLLTSNIKDIINDKDIDIVVEVIGGSEPARTFILECIRNKKHIVTSNKEVIAKHGRELFQEAAKYGVDVFCEGAVGGGIPIIRSLKMGLAANNIQEIYGIVNGTTNYILTKMADEGSDFQETLKEAQSLGYAEADPTSDIEGYDSSYKLVILSSFAFDAIVDFEDLYFEGISNISSKDNLYAKEFGYEIKLLAIGKKVANGIEVRVHPTMIPNSHPLSQIKGVNNAIYIKGDFVGETMFFGPGAGAEATGSAVVSDIIDIAYAIDQPLNKRNLRPDFKKTHICKIGEISSEYYIRIEVEDTPGVLATIAGIFGNNQVSIKSALQKDITEKGSELVIITHTVKEQSILNAVAAIKSLTSVYKFNSLIRVGI